MSIIEPKENAKQETVKFQLSSKLLSEVKAYCTWIQSDDDIGYFFGEAAEYVLKKDKAWNEYKRKEKSMEKASKKSRETA